MVPPERWYTSRQPSVSPATSDSAVSKKTLEPSWEIPLKITWNAPLPPAGPVDISVVVPLKRSYRSCVVSVSPDTSCSEVRKNTRVPSAEFAANEAPKAPFPPAGPVLSSVVVAPDRSYMSIRVSVSAATRASLLWKKMRLPSAEAPRNWLLTAPFPPAGPVETIAVTLWLPQAVAHIASASRTQRAPLLPSSIHPQSHRRLRRVFY